MNWETFLENLLGWLIAFGGKLILAIIVVTLGFKLTKLFLKLLMKSKRFHKIDPGAQTFIFSFLSITLNAVIILTAVAILGVPMTNFVAVLGSAGLAIGLALQGSLANLAGGLMILMFHPFRIGNYIVADNVSGTVKEITILYTILDTPDNVRIVVPNGQLSNAVVQNYSVNETRRCEITLGVSYKSDMRNVLSVLKNMCNECEMVLRDPEPFVRISSYDESQITVKVRVWVKATDYWTVYFDLTEKAKEVFDANNIEIPFPQLDVHLDK